MTTDHETRAREWLDRINFGGDGTMRSLAALLDKVRAETVEACATDIAALRRVAEAARDVSSNYEHGAITSAVQALRDALAALGEVER